MASTGVLVEQTLPPHASSVSRARALLREALTAAAADALVDDAQLALSEVVTNALVHAGTEVLLRAGLDAAGLRVEVTDGSPHLPALREYSLAAGTGRGLHMVTESVDAWGSYPRGTGKVVWFEIRTGGVATADSSREPDASREIGPADAALAPAEPAVDVELLNFPLLIHVAWQEHASALLREYLLVGLDLDGEDDVGAFVQHASASEAMHLLHEQVPAPELHDDPEAIMTTAVEPSVSAERLLLRIPQSTLDDFETLNAMLEEATALARSGALLVPTTQPEIAAMRRWICEQVREQSSRQAAPRAWSSEVAARSALETRDEPRELTQVARSDRALLAMDTDGMIAAVSPSAAALLGYQSPEQLRGQRLLRIVPRRYHQAHLAGTTLHHTNGRSPLLGRRITVPVVRADGEEVALGLLVQPRQELDGRQAFVAEFFDEG